MASSAIKPLGIIAIIYGGLQILFSLIVTTIGSTFAGMTSIAEGFPRYMLILPARISFAILFILMFIIFLNGALWLIGGIGFLSMKNWGRVLLIIGSIISLFSFPIGTIFGIIYLIFLFKKSVVRDMD